MKLEIMQNADAHYFYRQLEKVGYLFACECLVSTHKPEQGMLEDYMIGMRYLQNVKFRLNNEKAAMNDETAWKQKELLTSLRSTLASMPDSTSDEYAKKQQLANDIIDVQREWPKSQEELTLYVKDKYGANNSSDIHHYVLTADKSIVVDWDAAKASDGTYTALTNLQYEEEVNDKKRQIKVLNPLFLSAVSKQFNRLMK